MKTIQSRLIFILVIFLVLSIVGSVITIYSLSKQKSDGLIINLAGKQRMLTQKMSKEVLALSQGKGSKGPLKKTINLFDRTLKGLISGDNELGLPPTKNTGIVNQLNRVQELWNGFQANLNVIIASSTETTTALSYVNDNNIALLKEMNKAVEIYEEKSKEKVTITSWISIIVVGMVITTVVFTWFMIILPFIKTLNKVVSRVKDIAKGDLENKLDIDRSDEIGKLSESVNQMVDNFVEIEKQANVIAAGDYSKDVIPLSDKDELGKALQRMTKTLRDVSAENEKQNWLKTGQNELNDRMRGDMDILSLAREVILYLSKCLGAQIGALYIAENDNQLKLIGSYAFTKGKNFKNRIKVGEGLVGQAALDKEMITVTGIPEDTVRISSTYVDSTSYNVVVTPFTYEGELLGVIELGSFMTFSDMSLEFLSMVMKNIAINTITANARTKMKELLEKTQIQSGELQTQQEELKAANEELEEQTNALRVSEEELKSQQEELRVTNEELEEKAQRLEEKN